MTEHVAKVLEQIDGEVARLGELRAGLVKWFGDGAPDVPVVPTREKGATSPRPSPPRAAERGAQARRRAGMA